MKRWAMSSQARWSATSMPPTIITTASSNPPAADWAHPCSSQGQALLRDIHPPEADGRFTPGTDRWHSGLGYVPSSSVGIVILVDVVQAAASRMLLDGRVSVSRPSAQARLCRHINNHIKSQPRTRCGELFVFVAHSEAPADNPPEADRRAQSAPSGDQPQDQRRHPLNAGNRNQDDTGVDLRRLAGTRPQPTLGLQTTPRLPSSLNIYAGNCYSATYRWEVKRGIVH